MAHLFSTVALLLVAGMAMGPGDPVGIDDAPDTPLEPGQVSIELKRWEALRALVELEPPVVEAPGPWAADRQVQIERSSAGIRVRVSWALEAIEAGWLWGPLVGPMTGMRVESVSWRGREIGITRTAAGDEVALEMSAGSRGSLELIVFVPADQLPGGVDGDLELWLMPAVRGELRVSGAAAPEGRVPELVADGQARRRVDGRFWAHEAQLSLSWVDAKQDGAELERPLAVAQTAVGLTFGDAEVRGRARVSWLLRRGQLDAVSIDSAGLGRDLEVAGPNVHGWTRSGDRIDIELKDAVDGRVDVELRWTQAVPKEAEAQLSAPRITPRQAYRSESFMQIARDGELEVIPELAGWSAVARAELPEWAGGYIQGTATASYRREGGGGEDRGARFELLRFVPLSGPPVMVDVAAYEIATTEEGRSLVQARYDVRNERAAHLRVELPERARMLGVRVNGETVTPARDADGDAWRISLVRSLESVKGSLSFPVEVIFISEADAWTKKESRELQLPALDAPVAVSRVRVYLPPRYKNRVDVGEAHRVSDFSEGEGISYGLGLGLGSEAVARADELYREALGRWMSNDFQRAQSSLDELAELGASNANIEGLQANLDLVQGRGDEQNDEDGDGQSAVVSRRIKDQARVRAAEDKIALAEKAQEAEKLEAEGRYEQAEQKLAEAQELGDRLALLEQSESKEQAVYNQSLASSAARVTKKQERKVGRESKAKAKGRKNRAVDETVHDPVGTETATTSAGPVSGELAPPPPPEPMSLPPVEEETVTVTVAAEATESRVIITTEDAKSVPLGSNTSRDFTAVVDIAPTAASDAEPEPEPEPEMEMERGPMRIAKPSPPAQRRPRNRRGGGKKKSAIKAPPAPQQSATPLSAAQAPDPNAALAGPIATASAVWVQIPAIGEEVLYQHMLLPEGEALTVHLEARRHKHK